MRGYVLNIRVKFEKTGTMRYVGHLDVMRYFQKAIKRAGIDIAYTEGYSPHQIMSFASPLGVGVISYGDYFDMTVGSSLTSAEAIAALNAQMVDGLRVTGYRLLPEKSTNAMAAVAAADYFVTSKRPFTSLFSLPRINEEIALWFDKPESIIVVKKTKRGIAELDMKKLVHTLEAEGCESCPRFHLFIAQGSEASIRPEFVVEKLYEHMSEHYDVLDFTIQRNDLYTLSDDEYVSLGDIGSEIS